MDPLSVATSVVSLITATSTVTSALIAIKSSLSDAPQSMQRALFQVTELRYVLLAMDRFINGIAIPRDGRLGMIEVDQLVLTSTQAVLTLSKLEVLIEPLSTGIKVKILDRVKWSWKEDSILKILQRI